MSSGTVAQLLAEWRDYFSVVGTIAATFLGLLFVSVSLNAETILADGNIHLKQLAEQAYQSYVIVVLGSVLFLFPSLDLPTYVIVFGALGASGLAWSSYRLFHIMRISDAHYSWIFRLRRVVPGAVAYVLMIVAAWGVWTLPNRVSPGTSLGLLGIATVMLLISATASSWDLLVKVAQTRKSQRPPAP